MYLNFPGVEFLGSAPKFREGKLQSSSSCVYVLHQTTNEVRIKDFHAVAMHERQRNVPKSELHVKNCCFAY